MKVDTTFSKDQIKSAFGMQDTSTFAFNKATIDKNILLQFTMFNRDFIDLYDSKNTPDSDTYSVQINTSSTAINREIRIRELYDYCGKTSISESDWNKLLKLISYITKWIMPDVKNSFNAKQIIKATHNGNTINNVTNTSTSTYRQFVNNEFFEGTEIQNLIDNC